MNMRPLFHRTPCSHIKRSHLLSETIRSYFSKPASSSPIACLSGWQTHLAGLMVFNSGTMSVLCPHSHVEYHLVSLFYVCPLFLSYKAIANDVGT